MRLRRLGKTETGLHNRMVRYLTVIVIGYAALGYFFGAPGITFFAVQSIFGFTILEIINYVQHYGLNRRQTAPDRYESVKPIHSWNSDHAVSNWLLFNLPRHPDHHDHALKGYPSLRPMDEAPQLPCGYFALFFLSLIPPLWRRIMDPKVEAWRRKHGIKNEPFPEGEIL